MKKLNLGTELSKNAQKKVIGGGAAITCGSINGNVTFSSAHLSCHIAEWYCGAQYNGGHQMHFVSCYDW